MCYTKHAYLPALLVVAEPLRGLPFNGVQLRPRFGVAWQVGGMNSEECEARTKKKRAYSGDWGHGPMSQDPSPGISNDSEFRCP
jgi:hypothetical protein